MQLKKEINNNLKRKEKIRKRKLLLQGNCDSGLKVGIGEKIKRER
jgi:hypothetical protein